MGVLNEKRCKRGTGGLFKSLSETFRRISLELLSNFLESPEQDI